MTEERILALLQFLILIAGGIAAVIVFRREVAQLGRAHEKNEAWTKHIYEELIGVKETLGNLITRLETQEEMEAEFQRRQTSDRDSRRRLLRGRSKKG